MKLKKLVEHLEHSMLQETDNIIDQKYIMKAYKAATKDSSDWAYGWCDMDVLDMYADDAGMPFNCSEDELVKILKNNNIPVYTITKCDIENFLDNPDNERFAGFCEQDVRQLEGTNVIMLSGTSASDVIKGLLDYTEEF